MTGRGKKSGESGDLRLGDALMGLPCLRRQRAAMAGGFRGEQGGEPVCPICGIEVRQLRCDLGEGDLTVIGRVQERFPGWQPEDGLCGPCLERFR